jgi:hypothetical protein
MFYTFIVLFEKIKYSDRPYGSLQRFYCKRRKVTNLALTGWGCYIDGSLRLALIPYQVP